VARLRHAADLSRIDFNDTAVYDRICCGRYVGMFQIESRAQMQMIRRTRPRIWNDLAVEVASFAPDHRGGAVNPYVRRREAERQAHQQGKVYEPSRSSIPCSRKSPGRNVWRHLYQDQGCSVQALAGLRLSSRGRCAGP